MGHIALFSVLSGSSDKRTNDLTARLDIEYTSVSGVSGRSTINQFEVPVLLMVLSTGRNTGKSHFDDVVVGGGRKDVLVEQKVAGLDVVPFVVGEWLDGLNWSYVR